MDNAEIFATVYTYWAEILRPSGWQHIHHPDWETTGSYGDVMAYAVTVRDDYPGERVRIVERADGLPDRYVPVN